MDLVVISGENKGGIKEFIGLRGFDSFRLNTSFTIAETSYD